MMKRLKSFGMTLLIFVLFLVFSFVLFAAIILCLKEFFEISNAVFLWCALGISAFLSVVCTICIEVNLHRFKHSKFSFWIGKNYSKLIIAYVILIYALISVQNQINWTIEEVRDAVSLQWTIFGLSLAIFLVWNGIIVDFLKQKQPYSRNEQNGIKKYELLMKKKSFSEEVETTFSSIILLTVNFFLLLLSTSLVYIQNLSQNIFTQNVVLCSFNFSIGTIAILFLDILKPLKRDKVELLKDNTVTKNEVDNAQGIAIAQAIIEGIKKGVGGLDPELYSEEEKQQIFMEYMEALKESFENTENKKPKERQE